MKYYNLAAINSEQELFNIVAHHLLTQNQKSENIANNQCLYHDYKHNLQCAAGIFISEAEYGNGEYFEEKSWLSLVNDGAVSDKYSEMIFRLQGIHDSFSPKIWADKLRSFATARGLDSGVVD